MSSSGESSLIRDASLLLWANLAGVTIGAGGFLAVLAVKWISSATWFKILQQFLIAAAISTLSGDALLHLIIHAMVVEEDGGHGGNKTADHHEHDHEHGNDSDHEHQHDDEPHHHHHEEGSHDSQVYRGIAALVGIFVFIMLGRVSELIHTIRSRRSKKNLHNQVAEPSNAESANDETITELSYSPASMNDQADSSQEEGQNASGEYIRSNMSVQALLSHSEQKHGAAAESKQLLPQSDVERSLVNKADAYEESDSDAHEEHGHSHSHGHGHGHDHHIKGDLNGAQTLIGTVLIGDAMHNFCDGLVIGVGFASGKLGGLSTSIAVFCHELPHELGDFAFLLHCGMRMRNALLCNLISAVVCMAGLWTGLLLDRAFNSLAPWVYMFTAGMFLHIALATMIPELTLKSDSRNMRSGSRRACSGSTGDAVLRFAAQIGGLLFGAAVMICIAVYEDKLAGALQSG